MQEKDTQRKKLEMNIYYTHTQEIVPRESSLGANEFNCSWAEWSVSG